jgi:PTS hybrid protein
MPRKTPFSRTFTVTTTPGLQVQPAAMIARTLLPVKSTVVAEANGECADGKSVLELCSLQAACGTKIKFRAAGADATRALNALQHLFATQFRAPRLSCAHHRHAL